MEPLDVQMHRRYSLGSDDQSLDEFGSPKAGEQKPFQFQQIKAAAKEEEFDEEASYDKRSFIMKIIHWIFRRKKHFARRIHISGSVYPPNQSYPKNKVRNQKYSFLFFIPQVLYEQFKYFFNLYFLLIALSQFIPVLQVGFLVTYVAPLAFVLSLTMIKEAFDDLKRWRRDIQANSEKYYKLTPNGLKLVPSSKIKVGDMIVIKQDQRVPADCILLKTSEKNDIAFIRTDQMDGETEKKSRVPPVMLRRKEKDGKIVESKIIPQSVLDLLKEVPE